MNTFQPFVYLIIPRLHQFNRTLVSLSFFSISPPQEKNIKKIDRIIAPLHLSPLLFIQELKVVGCNSAQALSVTRLLAPSAEII